MWPIYSLSKAMTIIKEISIHRCAHEILANFHTRPWSIHITKTHILCVQVFPFIFCCKQMYIEKHMALERVCMKRVYNVQRTHSTLMHRWLEMWMTFMLLRAWAYHVLTNKKASDDRIDVCLDIEFRANYTIMLVSIFLDGIYSFLFLLENQNLLFETFGGMIDGFFLVKVSSNWALHNMVGIVTQKRTKCKVFVQAINHLVSRRNSRSSSEQERDRKRMQGKWALEVIWNEQDGESTRFFPSS